MPNGPLLIIPVSLLIIAIVLGTLAGLVIVLKLRSTYDQLSSQNKLLKALRALDVVAFSTLEIQPLCKAIVDVIHKELGYSIAIIALIDEKMGVIRRTAISLSPEEKELLHKIVPVKFEQQVLPLSRKENLFIKVINERRPFYTTNLYDIQVGVLPPEVSQEIQRTWNLKGVFLYPVTSRNKVIGILEYASSIEKEKLSSSELVIQEEFTAEISRVLENTLLYENLQVVSKQLEGANLKLMQLDKLKDDFVSVASHELRTPMAAIKSYAWMALNRSGIKLPDKLVKYLIRVLLSSERLINLVNDLLNISRIESGRIEISPEEVDMTALIRDIADEVYYSKSKEKDIQIVILEQKLPPVFADPEKLRQVLLNVMGNAVKFSPHGGKITVGFFTDGITVETNISDQGPGISKDDIGRLFQKFGRLDNSYVATATSGGTGLGLYISKSLIELMHGKIRGSSEGLGKGATFTLSLPVATRENILHKESFRIRAKGEVKGLEPVAI